MARILVIDDDIGVRVFLKTVLERSGYQVLEAADGDEALRLCSTSAVDLVITDIIMPEREGIDTILEIRRTLPEAKIIAISGGGRVGPRDYLTMAKMVGAARTFTKPIHPKELLHAVEQLLGDTKSTLS